MRFLNKPQKKHQIGVKEISQKKANLYFFGGLGLLLALCFLTVLASFTRTMRSSDSASQTEQVAVFQETDNRLQLFLESYITAYFNYSSETSQERDQSLMEYYNYLPEEKSSGGQKETKLVSYKLERILEDTAVYRVTYEVDEQRVTVQFGIPYAGENGQYYVSGLPYYEAVESYKAKDIKKGSALTLSAIDQVTDDERELITNFLNLFFTNYTTSQDNLDIVSKGIRAISGSTFKGLDYTYYKITDKEHITAYVQASFDILGVVHAENFTVEMTQKDDGSLYVTKLSHTIPSNYAKEEEKKE